MIILPQNTRLPRLMLGRYYALEFDFPFDLTGWGSRMQIRRSADKSSELIYEPTLSLDSASASSSILSFTIPETESLTWDRGNYTYWFEVVLENLSGQNEPYVIGMLPTINDISEAVA